MNYQYIWKYNSCLFFQVGNICISLFGLIVLICSNCFLWQTNTVKQHCIFAYNIIVLDVSLNYKNTVYKTEIKWVYSPWKNHSWKEVIIILQVKWGYFKLDSSVVWPKLNFIQYFYYILNKI